MAKITLNGEVRDVPGDLTVLEAARAAGVDIPSLCHHPGLGAYGACRVCVVEAEGPGIRKGLQTACTLPVTEGMTVQTESPAVVRARRMVFELLVGRSPDAEPLREMARRYGVETTRFGKGAAHDECVRCGLCVRACREKIGTAAISFAGRGQQRVVTTEFNAISDLCIGCGACAAICPTGTVYVEDKHGERAIRRRELTVARFRLEPCIVCGKPLVTEKFLLRRMQALPEESQPDVICLECKRARTAAGAETLEDFSALTL
jgi:NADH dehydrogenase/NADH:ubiquinone oxidoreductase subunit G